MTRPAGLPRRRPGAWLPLTLLLAGCAGTPRSDLTPVAEWRTLDAAPVEVVTREKTLPIVTDGKAENKWAAMFLADVLEETCGERPDVLVVLTNQTCDVREGLFIGGVNAGFAPILGDGFRVIAENGSVRFLGRADFAVFDWCERALGFRFYCPEGRCAEKRAAVVVPAVDYADRPVFEHRLFTGGNGEPWVRFAKAGTTHRGGVNVHAPHRWNRDSKLKAVHPEIFETGETPMLCYGNPATLAHYKDRIDRHIAGVQDSGGIVDTRRRVVTVCQWDAPVKCRCAWCRSSYDYACDRLGFASPVLWGRFLAPLSAWLREAHPDYMISFLPYVNTVRPPRGDWTWSGNVEAEVCTMPGLALLKNPACRTREEDIIRAWRARTGARVLNWHFSCWPLDWTSAPYVFGRTIRRHYAALRDDVCGSYVCGGVKGARLALSSYVWMKCLWNPELDVEAVYDGFARRMFGPAARPMRELIALQEACWERSWTDNVCSYRNIFEVSYPRADVERMKALVSEAYTLARTAGDEQSARRVRWYDGGLEKFFAESDALFARTARRIVPLGETNEMTNAEDIWHPKQWAKTRVSTSTHAGRTFILTVRCEDPAVGAIDFTKREDDFVWGTDCVTFVLDDGTGTKSAVVYPNGEVGLGEQWLGINDREQWTRGFEARIVHDASGWTVTAAVKLPEKVWAEGRVLGNVCRWRVGDRKLPEKKRVRGSRYEHGRLNTCYTRPNDDPAAFVEFRLR